MVCSLASLSPHLIEDKAVTSAFNLGSYPMSKVRGRRWEDPHARGEAAKRSYPTSEVRGSGQECQAAMVQEWPRGATRRPMPGAAAGRTYPTSQGRACGREEQPHLQGAVAAWAQEGLEELYHIEGQEGRWCGDTPCPR